LNGHHKNNKNQISDDILVIFYEILGRIDNIEKVTNKDEENKEEFNTASLKECIHMDQEFSNVQIEDKNNFYEFYDLEEIKENNT